MQYLTLIRIKFLVILLMKKHIILLIAVFGLLTSCTKEKREENLNEKEEQQKEKNLSEIMIGSKWNVSDHRMDFQPNDNIRIEIRTVSSDVVRTFNSDGTGTEKGTLVTKITAYEEDENVHENFDTEEIDFNFEYVIDGDTAYTITKFGENYSFKIESYSPNQIKLKTIINGFDPMTQKTFPITFVEVLKK